MRFEINENQYRVGETALSLRHLQTIYLPKIKLN
jgi:hypothetical protein